MEVNDRAVVSTVGCNDQEMRSLHSHYLVPQINIKKKKKKSYRREIMVALECNYVQKGHCGHMIVSPGS